MSVFSAESGGREKKGQPQGPPGMEGSCRRVVSSSGTISGSKHRAAPAAPAAKTPARRRIRREKGSQKRRWAKVLGVQWAAQLDRPTAGRAAANQRPRRAQGSPATRCSEPVLRRMGLPQCHNSTIVFTQKSQYVGQCPAPERRRGKKEQQQQEEGEARSGRGAGESVRLSVCERSGVKVLVIGKIIEKKQGNTKNRYQLGAGWAAAVLYSQRRASLGLVFDLRSHQFAI
ncbi:hypothetical protein EJ05DRAFT_482757 [Pseudovirgaria hyperparasitica]|uniref:Uncharacterized protein n=1 Tax=Pseudovirgaria hyperparasitica TaxID=470096 RepID=A0A6A6WIR3_9PEZI|nr:uncharacterized protein EJ05DRAFT_482757 [Pseudovirgaria hyperparasitica]KAF2761950.1 hypothetical protein EJ05DRAFT_482757 [Pseudovirgaria hyperparasitica]